MKVSIPKLIRGNRYSALRILAVILTIVLVIVHRQIPDKKMVLVPSNDTYHGLYGPELSSGEASFKWVDEQANIWRCNKQPQADYSCGYSLSLSGGQATGRDLTEYKYFLLKLRYTGEAKHIRLSMRHYNPAYVTGNREQTSKFMSMLIQTADLDGEVAVQLSEFTVAEWWMQQFDIPREFSAPEFDNVISLSFDYVSPGDHLMEVESIQLVGSWLSTELLYQLILAFWLLVILWESISKFIQLYRRYEQAQVRTEPLVKDYRQLEETK